MSSPSTSSHPERVTVRTFAECKRTGRKITLLTCYDATFAHWLDRAGVDVLMVGDSLGMVFQGHGDTLAVTLEDVVYHSRAISRGTKRAHIVADMPFMTYQVSADLALQNAGRLLSHGRAHSVKLEGGQPMAATVERLVSAGIPVMGHVGLTPQRVHAMGGYRMQGGSDESATRIREDAEAIAAAGAFAVVLECIPQELAAQITESLSVPTIGIGAGSHCDGQVLVSYDMLGLTPQRLPRFVKRYAELGQAVSATARSFCDEVRGGEFPAPAHSYRARGSSGGSDESGKP